jgi:hypothetical protein
MVTVVRSSPTTKTCNIIGQGFIILIRVDRGEVKRLIEIKTPMSDEIT